jgi:hypothetical protein
LISQRKVDDTLGSYSGEHGLLVLIVRKLVILEDDESFLPADKENWRFLLQIPFILLEFFLFCLDLISLFVFACNSGCRNTQAWMQVLQLINIRVLR